MLYQDSGGIGKSIPSALEIFLGRGFCTPRPSGFPSGFALGKSLGSRGAKPTASENLSDFPRPSRFPSGFALGKSLGSREIGRRGWISQYLPRLGGARIHSCVVKQPLLINISYGKIVAFVTFPKFRDPHHPLGHTKFQSFCSLSFFPTQIARELKS